MKTKKLEKSVTFNVKVVPRSSQTEIVGFFDGELKVKVKSPPVDGRANGEVISLIASSLGVKTEDVTIIKGESASRKVIRVKGVEGEGLINIFKHKFHRKYQS
ncbi:MAG: DUF167 domain-containing protein [Syntrophales bacterium]|nr:DUF167 domain-containing protein [Syntrophales bacterium]